jgi:hypothetical protein
MASLAIQVVVTKLSMTGLRTVRLPNSRADTVLSRLTPGFEGRSDSIPLNDKLLPMVERDIDIKHSICFALLRCFSGMIT